MGPGGKLLKTLVKSTVSHPTMLRLRSALASVAESYDSNTMTIFYYSNK